MELEPALPWGVVETAQTKIKIICDLPKHLKLPVGSARIEVYWMVEEEVEGEDDAAEIIASSKVRPKLSKTS